MSSEIITPTQEEGKGEQAKPEINLGFDGTHFHMKVPIAAGKLAVYGAIELLREEAWKTFMVIERMEAEKEAKNKSMLSKLHIPGLRTH